MSLPIILGLPIHIWLGILVFALIIFQVLNGLKIIKVPFKWHKRTALLILLIAILHAVVGLGLWFGWFYLK